MRSGVRNSVDSVAAPAAARIPSSGTRNTISPLAQTIKRLSAISRTPTTASSSPTASAGKIIRTHAVPVLRRTSAA